MACPHVVGTAALIWCRYPNMTRDQVRIHLRKTAQDLGTLGFDDHYGFGLVDANASISHAPPSHDVAIINWERPSYANLNASTITNTTVLNYGTAFDWVNASLIVNGTIVNSTTIGLEGGQTSTVSLSWTPQTSGVYNLTSLVSSTYSSATDCISANVTTEASTIKVPLCRKSIQEGIDVARSGDTISVANGTYHEIVNVWKDNLTIRGEDKRGTIIDCKDKDSWGFLLYGRHFVRIEGFTIKRTQGGRDGGSSIMGFAGVSLAYSWNCTINDNIMSFHTIAWITYYAYGLLLTFSFGNNITKNKFEHNMIGMAIKNGSSDNRIAGNHFYWNGGRALGDGGLMLVNASNNMIYHNNFIYNECHLRNDTVSSNYWHGRWNVTGSYWDNYTGSDTNGDGVGDTPPLPQQQVDYLPLMAPWLPGDITHDGSVGPADFARLAAAYGSTPGSPTWDPHADLDENAIVGPGDFAILSKYFGQDWTTYWGYP